MAVTRSSAGDRRQTRRAERRVAPRGFEFVALLIASVIVLCALALTYQARSAEAAATFGAEKQEAKWEWTGRQLTTWGC